jgi:hypothetical protein
MSVSADFFSTTDRLKWASHRCFAPVMAVETSDTVSAEQSFMVAAINGGMGGFETVSFQASI